jgi:MFS family permease
VLVALILVAAVANLNLAVANVALPSIGQAFDASQTELDLIAVGYSLGLAASVLYFGAIGDRYGRKLLLIVGTALAIPASCLAAWAPNADVLIAARIIGGLAAGMAYPTTLALITALWAGPARTKSIALWSGLGGAISALGPLLSGLLLEHFWWGSVFLLTLPLAVVAVVMAWRLVPAHVNETTERIDNLGGILSVVFVGALILAINFAPVPNAETLTLVLAGIAIVGLGAFYLRQRRAQNPLYDLHVAGRRVFWVAAAAGIIVFGSLMGAMFVGQQFLQNVLGYSTLEAGAAILPAALFMVLVAPRSAKIVARRRFLAGTSSSCSLRCCSSGREHPVLEGHSATRSSGSVSGCGHAGPPAHGLGASDARRDVRHSRPATRPRRRDRTSIMGALLTAGYAAAAAISASSKHISDGVRARSRVVRRSGRDRGAVQYASQITPQRDPAGPVDLPRRHHRDPPRRDVFFGFPAEQEESLLEAYHTQDAVEAVPQSG